MAPSRRSKRLPILYLRGRMSWSMFSSTKYCFTGSLAALFTLLILGSGCSKAGSGTKPPTAEVEAKLTAIRQGGEPVTLTELDAWYVEPPVAENAAPLYAEAFAAMTLEDANSSSFREQNQKALGPLHQAAARTHCRYPVDLKAGYKASMPHLPKIKVCAQLLAQQAFVAGANGKMDIVADSIIDGLRLARSLNLEPAVISQTTRVRAEQIAVAGLIQALDKGRLSEKDLGRLQSAFDETEKGGVGMFARAFAGERCMIISLFQAPSQELVEALTTLKHPFPASFIDNYRRSSTNQEDFAFCLDALTSLVAAAKLPFPESLDVLSQQDEQVNKAQSKGYLIAGIMLPSLGKPLENSAARLGELRAAQGVIAIERYRLTHANALPVGLSALVPQYLSAVPLDPFDGKPLRFKKTSPKGYVVYSIGQDRQDDGGTALKRDSPPGTKFDLVVDVRR